MSSFYFTFNQLTPELASRIKQELCFVPESGSWEHTAEDCRIIATRVDDPIIWSPYFDKEKNIAVVVGGRIAFDHVTWQNAMHRAKKTQGIAAQEGFHRYLEGGD